MGRVLQIGPGGRQIRRRVGPFRARQNLAVAIQDVDGGIAENLPDLGEGVIELDPVVEQAACAIQLIGDRHQIRVHRRGDIPDIGAPDHSAVLDRSLDILAEPLVDAPRHQQAEHQGDQHRRNDGHHGEQGDEPQVQPRPRVTRAARQGQDPSPDDKGQTRYQRQIGQQDEQHRLAGRSPRRAGCRTGRRRHQPNRRGGYDDRDEIGEPEPRPGAFRVETPPERLIHRHGVG